MSKRQKGIGVAALAICLILVFFTRRSGVASSGQRQVTAVKTNGPALIQGTRDRGELTTTGTPLPADTQSVQPQTEQMRQELQLWHTPLLFYGKVVDESNRPIAGVQVSYSGNAMDESLAKEIRNNGSVVTDQQGIFKIDGLYGIGLMFELSHPDYYPYPDNSTGFDVRSPPRDGAAGNSEAYPQIFRMHSKGDPVSLIYRSGGFHAANNGTIANYPLRGRTRAEVLGQLQIQGWTGLRSDTNDYDWKVQLTIPNGGIVESTNYFDFIAPKTGYAGALDFEVGGGESLSKTFFLSLPAGYIRFKLLIIMGKDMFVTADYYFNPDGSRNLEAGEVIHPTQ
ncbi:MAG TPA: hypothetical protein VMF08_21880 [Candidatus Sulfotelmatobacter sp.]|nr:hypothetical protein [Candidatus Sulfotelmatobacter sp.]